MSRSEPGFRPCSSPAVCPLSSPQTEGTQPSVLAPKWATVLLAVCTPPAQRAFRPLVTTPASPSPAPHTGPPGTVQGAPLDVSAGLWAGPLLFSSSPFQTTSVMVPAGNRWHVPTIFWKAFGRGAVDRRESRARRDNEGGGTPERDGPGPPTFNGGWSCPHSAYKMRLLTLFCTKQIF